MFRELTRIKNKLSDEACIRILTTEKRGVLSVNGDGGYPYAMPMNHYYNPDDGAIYFHCGKTGHRLDSLKKDGKASFCVYDGGFRKDGAVSAMCNSIGAIQPGYGNCAPVQLEFDPGIVNDTEGVEKMVSISDILCPHICLNSENMFFIFFAHSLKVLFISI